MYVVHERRSNLVWGYFGLEGKCYEWMGKWCPEDTPAALHVNWIVHDDSYKLRSMEHDLSMALNQISIQEMEKRAPGFEEKLMASFIYHNFLRGDVPNERDFPITS